LLSALLLAACGGKGGADSAADTSVTAPATDPVYEACLEYRLAANACLFDAFDGEGSVIPLSFCDAYQGLSGSEAEAASAFLDCSLAIFAGRDCADADDYNDAALDQSETC
jgi:hypothetical protein